MEQIKIAVQTEEVKKKQGDLFGIFFEDLNHAADGGLYGELVRNRSFEFEEVDGAGYHGLTAWEKIERNDSVVQAHVETREPINANNPHYLKLEVAAPGEGGIRNAGFAGGIPVKEGSSYDFSCYFRLRRGKNVAVEIRLEDTEGKVGYASESFVPIEGNWQRFDCVLNANKTDSSAKIALLSSEPISVDLDMISLFPVDTFKKRKNGLRADIAELLADMKPCFMRFPGGCLIHIGSLDADDHCGMYRWKNTLGIVEQRASKRNTWNYNQTLGLGFYEFFVFCEDIGAQPLPVISAGYDPHNLRAAALEDMQEWIDEALDLIEFANGETETAWGAIRAQMGHPDVFHLKYLGIGNEEVGDEFFERYEIILKAVKEKYPEIEVINSAGPGSAGSEFAKGWEQSRRTQTSYVDEHFYQSPEWFIANANRYEGYESHPKAFLGEYASKGECWKNALAEAAFMIGMEKAEGAGLACYAPMLCNVNYQNWFPNMINFDNYRVYGSPSYYVQKQFMNKLGEVLLETTDDIKKREKTSPKLSGRIGMSTQQAQVTVTQFRFTDNETGETTEIPDFILAKDYNQKFCLNTDSSFYTVSYRFSRKGGGRAGNLEGLNSFNLEFAGADENNKIVWTIDGWQQLTSLNGFYMGESCDMGLHLFETKMHCEYEAKLVVEGNQITTFIDGVQYCNHRCKSIEPDALYYSAVKESNGTVIVKAANTEAAAKEICIELHQRNNRKYKKVRISAMEGFALEDKNSLEEPQKVIPTERILELICNQFTYLLPGNSFTVFCFEE